MLYVVFCKKVFTFDVGPCKTYSIFLSWKRWHIQVVFHMTWVTSSDLEKVLFEKKSWMKLMLYVVSCKKVFIFDVGPCKTYSDTCVYIQVVFHMTWVTSSALTCLSHDLEKCYLKKVDWYSWCCMLSPVKKFSFSMLDPRKPIVFFALEYFTHWPSTDIKTVPPVCVGSVG